MASRHPTRIGSGLLALALVLAATGDEVDAHHPPEPATPPPLLGLLLRVLGLFSAPSSDFLEKHRFDLELAARSLGVVDGVRLLDPALKFKRGAVSPTGTGPWAVFQLGASSLTWRSLRVAALDFSGFVDPDLMHLEGTAVLDGAPVACCLELESDCDPSGSGGATGWFTAGPVQFRDYRVPETLAGDRELRLTGRTTVHGPIRLRADGRWEGQPTIELDLDRLTWPEKTLTIEDCRATLGLASLRAWVSRTNDLVRLGRITFGTYEATNVLVRLQWLSAGVARLELDQAGFLGGELQVAPFDYDLAAGRLDLVLEVQSVDLGRLSEQLHHFAGSLEGRIAGRIPLRLRSGQLTIRGGQLDLDRRYPARFGYPADGLFTEGLPADSSRYTQLRLVEEGLKDLTLEGLTLQLYAPDESQTALRIRLEGTSRSTKAIVPIILNLNLNGDLEHLLRLLERVRE